MSGFEAVGRTYEHPTQPFKKICLSARTEYAEDDKKTHVDESGDKTFYPNSKRMVVMKLFFYCNKPVTTGGKEYPAGSFFIGVIQGGEKYRMIQYGEKYKSCSKYKIFGLPTGYLDYSENLSGASIDRHTKKTQNSM